MKSKTRWVYRLVLVVLVLGFVGLISLFTGCSKGLEDGTITVRIVNAGAQNGQVFILAVFVAGADPIGVGDEPIALGGYVIAGGTAEDLA